MTNGAVVAVHLVSVSSKGKTFVRDIHISKIDSSRNQPHEQNRRDPEKKNSSFDLRCDSPLQPPSFSHNRPCIERDASL
jgi:hypothetical protein